MTDLAEEEPEGATPLTPEAREGLIPSNVTLRSELNEVEQANINEALLWSHGRKHNPVAVPFGKNLHRRMFGKVWRWAGDHRKSDTNIGVDHAQIDDQLYQLVGNAQWWIDNKTFEADEIAIRFKHRLVAIHPFLNGNGRWSREMGNVLARRLDRPTFTWGGSQLVDHDAVRKAYLAALRKADGDDFPDLLAFARS